MSRDLPPPAFPHHRRGICIFSKDRAKVWCGCGWALEVDKPKGEGGATATAELAHRIHAKSRSVEGNQQVSR